MSLLTSKVEDDFNKLSDDIKSEVLDNNGYVYPFNMWLDKIFRNVINNDNPKDKYEEYLNLSKSEDNNIEYYSLSQRRFGEQVENFIINSIPNIIKSKDKSFDLMLNGKKVEVKSSRATDRTKK